MRFEWLRKSKENKDRDQEKRKNSGASTEITEPQQKALMSLMIGAPLLDGSIAAIERPHAGTDNSPDAGSVPSLYGYHPATELSYPDGRQRLSALRRLHPAAAQSVPVGCIYGATPMSRLSFLSEAEGVPERVARATQILWEGLANGNRPVKGALRVGVGSPMAPAWAPQCSFDPAPVIRRILDQELLSESALVDLLAYAGLGWYLPRFAGEPMEKDPDADVWYENAEEEDV